MPHILSYIVILAVGLISMVLDPAYAEGTVESTETVTSGSFAEAQTLIKKEKFTEALALLEDLTAAQPENADAWNLRGYSNRKLGNHDAAATAYATALRLHPGHLGALEYQGEMFIETGQIDLARANLASLKSLCGTCEQAVDLENSIQKSGS